MDTEHLKTFVEVVQQGSFAAAARKLDIDPSAVTRAIASLEKDLGLRLLERTTRQLVGPALLADWLVADDLAAGRLVDLFPEYEATPTDFDNAVWLLHTSRSYVPKRVRAFVEFMKQRIRSTNSALGAPAVLTALSKDPVTARNRSSLNAQRATHSVV